MPTADTKPAALHPLHPFSAWLSGFCLLLIVTLPIAVAWYWAWADAGTLVVRANLRPEVVVGDLAVWQRLTGGAVAETSLLPMLIGLWQARRFFRLCNEDRVFSAVAAGCLRSFAAWAVAAAAAAMLGNVAISILLTVNNPPGSRYLAVGISSDHLLLLFFAGLVYLMAKVIHQGQVLADENARFI